MPWFLFGQGQLWQVGPVTGIHQIEAEERHTAMRGEAFEIKLRDQKKAAGHGHPEMDWWHRWMMMDAYWNTLTQIYVWYIYLHLPHK